MAVDKLVAEASISPARLLEAKSLVVLAANFLPTKFDVAGAPNKKQYVIAQGLRPSVELHAIVRNLAVD